MKRVLGSIRRADERYHLFEDGDRVCIGVSGGKDSLLLMEALKLYQRFSKTRFDVCAVSLDLGIVEQDWSAVTAFAERIGIDYSLIKTDIGDVVFNIRQEKSPCALCAKLRRGALNNAARDRGCNKVALGHNREDVIESFLLEHLVDTAEVYNAEIYKKAPPKKDPDKIRRKMEKLKDLYLDDLIDRAIYERDYKALEEQLAEADIVPLRTPLNIEELAGSLAMYTGLSREAKKAFWSRILKRIEISIDGEIFLI